MMRFVRLSGGAAGAVVAITLASGAPGFFDPSLAGRLLLAAWITAWTVIGYSIMPYITVQPAVRLVRNVMVAKRDDLLQGLRSLGLLDRAEVRAEPGQRSDGPPVYVDTSAIIDGRISDVAAAGFLIGTLVVPRFVLDELQRTADHGDTARRTRGRRGLDILSQLQKDLRVSFELSDEDAPGIDEVDGKLVSLARARNGAVMTTDYNLNRVAQLQGVRVLNLNHLANASKPAFLPGEEMRVKVIQQGKEQGQGVAFLDDGTMIAVEGGGSHLQRELDVTVTRVLQTVAGRMVFAHPRP